VTLRFFLPTPDPDGQKFLPVYLGAGETEGSAGSWHHHDWENHGWRPALANGSCDPISKISIAKWTGGVAQGVEHMLSKYKALSLNPSLTKKEIVTLELFVFSIFFFLRCWGLNSGPTTWDTPPALFWWWFFFRDRVLQTICPGWLWTTILLITVSWVARISGVSHHHPPYFLHLYARDDADFIGLCESVSWHSTDESPSSSC
jgi:hypothetical protein